MPNDASTLKSIRRLVLCLDGTWNNRDDSTNVLHHFSLAYECNRELRDGTLVTQQRFYNEGVGTGPLDRITGGGFGLGLEDHVRAAYDWLVQNYEDGNPHAGIPADEIYIFGFSRGAYEARSLVGFIAKCGLLRRGAPLTVNQLWTNYCLLGRDHEERTSFWQLLFPPAPRDFRPLAELEHLNPNELSPTEELLKEWSRRVKITYLGVYDTVGAIGWDALAIPGVRSKLALHNNMRPTTIIQHCRHALALDEHRSSFNHTPFVAYIGESISKDESARAGVQLTASQDSRMSAGDWQKVRQMWDRKIHQRWFVGAHSNIGGGYPDNYLARKSLAWLMEGASDLGLICEKLPVATQLPGPPQELRRDSFGEFFRPWWVLVFRAKRNYRSIAPCPELRANREAPAKDQEPRPGFSLVHIKEELDESVLAYWDQRENPPPNLVAYAKRFASSDPKLNRLKEKPPLNPWLAGGIVPPVALGLWATFAAAGVAVADRFFCVCPTTPPWGVLCILAFLFAATDGAESWANFSLAKAGQNRPELQAFLDSAYWVRALGVVLFFCGLLGGLVHLWDIGWNAKGWCESWIAAWQSVRFWGWVPVGAVAGILAGNRLNQSVPQRALLLKALWSVPLVALGIPSLILLGHAVGHVVQAALNLSLPIAPTHAPGKESVTATLLLLLQLGVACLLRAWAWATEPMHTANLGDITELQKHCTPEGVKTCLDRWCKMLGDHHNERESECSMAFIVRQALWRDVFGFIPVYTLVLGFGLWFETRLLGWDKSLLSHLWFILPAVTLVADYLEDLCEFHYLSLHTGPNPGRPSLGLTLAGALMTFIKFLGVLIGVLATFTALVTASWRIFMSPEHSGWPGLLAVSISAGAVGLGILIGMGSVIYKCKRHGAGVQPLA